MDQQNRMVCLRKVFITTILRPEYLTSWLNELELLLLEKGETEVVEIQTPQGTIVMRVIDLMKVIKIQLMDLAKKKQFKISEM
jgi:hypothetical protein